MPALSPTMEEGTLAKWHVKAGDNGALRRRDRRDRDRQGHHMEVEAVDEGVVEEILVPEGAENVKVNAPIARLKVERARSAAGRRACQGDAPPVPLGCTSRCSPAAGTVEVAAAAQDLLAGG